MVISRCGGSWFGVGPGDVDEYVTAYARAAGEHVGRVAHALCPCGGSVFSLAVDDDQGLARRRCAVCGGQHLMLDSGEHVQDGRLQECGCPCGGEQFELAVGYGLNESGRIRWVFIAARCVADGLLGVYTDWSIDYEPADHLFALA